MSTDPQGRYKWPCSVPGCRCTVRSNEPYAPGSCWALCRKHWPLVPKAHKAVLRRAFKRQLTAPATLHRHARRAYLRVSDHVIRHALAAAVGIG